MQVVETLKELYESSMKKNKRLSIKIKSEAFWGKLKSSCLVFLVFGQQVLVNEV